jgi:hypothetical protein
MAVVTLGSSADQMCEETMVKRVKKYVTTHTGYSPFGVPPYVRAQHSNFALYALENFKFNSCN